MSIWPPARLLLPLPWAQLPSWPCHAACHELAPLLLPCRCEPGAAPLHVAVLLSGGVDSSLALHLLKAAGHHVTAFYLQVGAWTGTEKWQKQLGRAAAACRNRAIRTVMPHSCI